MPATIVAAAATLLVFHTARLMMAERLDLIVIYTFGFVPARYTDAVLAAQLPGGSAAAVWSFVTYAFLHADWVHLGVNAAWMVAFGTPVARRFGAARFLALSLVSAVAGALAHLAFHAGELIPMIGASAAISGQMAAAIRFAFQDPGRLRYLPPGDDRRWQMPALPLLRAFRNVRVLAFVVIWFTVNFAFGSVSVVPGEPANIAWEAHVGGFLVGLLLFRLFDPRRDPPEMPMPWNPDEPRDPGATEDHNSGSS